MPYDLHQRLGYKLALAAQVNNQTMITLLADIGLTRQSWCVLVAVEAQGISQPSAIADYVGIKRAAVSRSLKDMSLKYPEINGATVATTALALIGLFNVIGTYYAGVLGQRFPKRFLLSGIYISRSVAITLFLLFPLSATTTYVFAAVMGVLWLSTIPLTNAIVAQIFGVKYLTMLSGVVFFSHQLGSFCGAYFGGYLYDLTGSYQIVWGIAIALGVFACLINLPIREEPLVRPAMA